jgi:chromosome segregation ATPase
MLFFNKRSTKNRLDGIDSKISDIEEDIRILTNWFYDLEERINYMAVSLTDLNEAVDKATSAQAAAAAKITALVADVKKASEDLAAAVAAGHPDNTVDPAEIAAIVDKLKASTDALTAVVG